MKSIFSHFFKSSLLNRVMRLIIVVVCLSYSAAASATNYYLKCKAAVATNSTGKGKVYIFKNEKTSNDAPDQGKETDETSDNWESTSQNRKVTLFAYPEKGYYHRVGLKTILPEILLEKVREKNTRNHMWQMYIRTQKIIKIIQQ
jgi:hypothetical protein